MLGSYARTLWHFLVKLVGARIVQVLSCLVAIHELSYCKRGIPTELGDDFQKHDTPFHLCCLNEVTKIRETVNGNFGTGFSDKEIVQIIEFTVRMPARP